MGCLQACWALPGILHLEQPLTNGNAAGRPVRGPTRHAMNGRRLQRWMRWSIRHGGGGDLGRGHAGALVGDMGVSPCLPISLPYRRPRSSLPSAVSPVGQEAFAGGGSACSTTSVARASLLFTFHAGRDTVLRL